MGFPYTGALEVSTVVSEVSSVEGGTSASPSGRTLGFGGAPSSAEERITTPQSQFRNNYTVAPSCTVFTTASYSIGQKTNNRKITSPSIPYMMENYFHFNPK